MQNVLIGDSLFVTYPYVLPCIVAAAITLAGVLTGVFFLPETLKRQAQTVYITMIFVLVRVHVCALRVLWQPPSH